MKRAMRWMSCALGLIHSVSTVSATSVSLRSDIGSRQNTRTDSLHEIVGGLSTGQRNADSGVYDNSDFYNAAPYEHISRSPVYSKRTRRKEHLLLSTDNISLRNKRNIGISNLIMTQHFSEKVLTPGEEVSLHCASTADRPPRFIWERDGVVITSNTDQRYTIGQLMSPTGIGVVSHLNISRARVEDGGLYSCVALEGEQSVSYAARVDVYGPPYIRTLPPIKVQSGQQMKLRCPYYGYPINKLEWEYKGKRIQSTTLAHHVRFSRETTKGRKNRRQIFEPDGVLTIDRASKDESGESYTCVVYSPSGEMARRSFEIQVVEAPELDELRMGSGLKEGQIVQITCNIMSGDPPIYFSWLKDGKKIPQSLKVTEKSSELFSVLIIKRVSLEHCGRYTCVATNHVGKVNRTAELYVNVAPKWVEEPKNTSLLLGQRGLVYCNANGYPPPQIHWMKRDASLGVWRPVLDLAGGGIVSLSNGTLIIEVVSLTDDGAYACHAENGVGDALSSTVWISVNKPVHFESPSTNLTTKLGLPVELSCQPLGDSPVRVKWTLDGKPLDLSHSRITISDNVSPHGVRSTVGISYVEARDGGHYECRGSNPYGVAIHSIFLSILEPPTPPLDLQVDSITSRSARVSWGDIISAHVQYYALQYGAAQYGVWESAKSVNVTRHNADRQALELRDLQPSTEYRVRVASANQVDRSHYTQPAVFTTLQEAPSSSPLGVQALQTDSPGELAVAWLSPARDSHHGPLQGFHVRAVPRIGGEMGAEEAQTKVVKVLMRKGKQETTISGLLKNTRYAVSVSAFNSAGNGPFSSPVYQTTREGAPETAPSSVECRGVSSTSVRVAWQPITAQETSLLGYTVYYGHEDAPWMNLTSPHTEVYLQSLMKYTNYTVKVAGFSNYGVGPFSHPITCATLQDVPGQPALVKVIVSSSSSLLVSWKRPEQPNGEITHYTVYVKHASSTNTPESHRVPTSPDAPLTRYLSYDVKGLSEGRQYEVAVSASTRAGEGLTATVISRELTSRVVAGVWSLGGTVALGAGSSVLLACACVGSPPPRTVWYHQHNIITYHPRYTRNHDDSLLINNIDQSLSGNYTCLAKNLYGSDSVSYTVVVLPTPDPPRLRAIPHRNSLHLSWDQNTGKNQKIYYNLTWKEANASWKDAWSNKVTVTQGAQEYTLEGLRCGTKYSMRMTALNSVGSSQPAYLDATTLGGVPVAPSTTEWFWSNATHMFIQLSGWDDNGCDLTKWDVEYREYGTKVWNKAENKLPQSDQPWNHYTALMTQLNSFVISDLTPAQWYHVKVSAGNTAGVTTTIYSYATTTILGETIGPPNEMLDLNILVIIFSSVLLTICFITCVYILVKRHNSQRLTEYRNSLTESKSERSNAANTPSADAARVYSTPIHMPGDAAKHELYEISPYAQFAIGFRTFGHVENQEAPRQPGGSKSRYDSETSFQMRSESEDSDCVSRPTTLKSVPRKACRVPHHR